MQYCTVPYIVYTISTNGNYNTTHFIHWDEMQVQISKDLPIGIKITPEHLLNEVGVKLG